MELASVFQALAPQPERLPVGAARLRRTPPRRDDSAETSAPEGTVRREDLRPEECRRCERLVEWREKIAQEKRAAYAEEQYWGRGVPGFGDPAAKVVIVGLAPAAHGANRTGRVFTGDRSGDFLFASLYRLSLIHISEPTRPERIADCVVWV